MITNSNGSSPLHILWPNRYEISHAANLGYNDLVTDEQSIANWDWIKMRLQKATTADEQRRCGYDKCDDPITIENKKEFNDRNNNGGFWGKRITFNIGMHVVREQFSAQTFNTLHVMCAVRKLHEIQSQLSEGIENLMESTHHLIDEGINYNDE